MNPDWFAAAERGDALTLARLLESGIEVDAPGEFGWTALMSAVWGRHIDAVRWLLSRGADPNRQANHHTAMTLGALCARGWQLEAGRCRAKLMPDAQFLDLLMSAGGRIGLREAILLGDLGMAQRIIDGEGSIDVNGESKFGMNDTFLMLAAHVGPVTMVDLLLDKGAEVDGTDDVGYTALLLAAEMGRVDIVNRLLDRGATIQNGWELDFALNQADRDGHTEVIDLLLSRGAKRGEWDTIDPGPDHE